MTCVGACESISIQVSVASIVIRSYAIDVLKKDGAVNQARVTCISLKIRSASAHMDSLTSVSPSQALFKEDNDLRSFLTNPVITEEQKKDIVNNLAKEAKFSEFFVNFINILIDQDRLVSADAIFESFEKRYCELTDTQVALQQLHCDILCWAGPDHVVGSVYSSIEQSPMTTLLNAIDTYICWAALVGRQHLLFANIPGLTLYVFCLAFHFVLWARTDIRQVA